ncbi:phasin family protein [Parasporobacterium paucivorans]|uniref:Polyhydroxyalkanoate synthesis regulator phasin n=1 Tax=Parasporobacterium paucivorans DSM 15970 TaxID=1122934 RepID=A0A1M6DFU4_9FIRM|nr:hypothetical protein [Parasporobacterium paucivorans]SHI72204.1 Polyhydroxyalkanoate synthesis regulator phasin [Parasporobacterium paucivorans DSM 15970]
MDISLKNIILAGIGSMAYSYEKGTELIENMIKKGEISVAQGMEINEELKRKKVTPADKDSVTAEQLKEMLLNLATKDDIKDLEKRITELENK